MGAAGEEGGEVPGQEPGEKGIWEGGERFQPPPPAHMLGPHPMCFAMGEPREKWGAQRLGRVGEMGWGRQGPGRRGLSRLSPWEVKGFWQPEGLGVSLPWRETVCVFMDVPGYQVTMCVQVYAQLGGACAPGAHTCTHSCEGRSIWFPQIASPAPDGAPIPSWQVPGLNIWPRLPMGRESWHPVRARRAQPSPSAYTPTEGQGLCRVTGQSRDSRCI